MFSWGLKRLLSIGGIQIHTIITAKSMSNVMRGWATLVDIWSRCRGSCKLVEIDMRIGSVTSLSVNLWLNEWFFYYSDFCVEGMCIEKMLWKYKRVSVIDHHLTENVNMCIPGISWLQLRPVLYRVHFVANCTYKVYTSAPCPISRVDRVREM